MGDAKEALAQYRERRRIHRLSCVASPPKNLASVAPEECRVSIEKALREWVCLEEIQALIWGPITALSIGSLENAPEFHTDLAQILRDVVRGDRPLSGNGGLAEILMQRLPFLRSLLLIYADRLLDLAATVRDLVDDDDDDDSPRTSVRKTSTWEDKLDAIRNKRPPSFRRRPQSIALDKKDLFRPVEALAERRKFVEALLRYASSDEKTSRDSDDGEFPFRWSEADAALLRASLSELDQASRAMDVCVHPIRGTFSLYARLARAGFAAVPRSVAAPRRELHRCGVLDLRYQRSFFSLRRRTTTCLVALLVEDNVTCYVAYAKELARDANAARDDDDNKNSNKPGSFAKQRSLPRRIGGQRRFTKQRSAILEPVPSTRSLRASSSGEGGHFGAPDLYYLHAAKAGAKPDEIVFVLAPCVPSRPSPPLESTVVFKALDDADARAWLHDLEAAINRTSLEKNRLLARPALRKVARCDSELPMLPPRSPDY